MHFEEAFSIQLGQWVTAEHAYELFWAGVIDDKKAFQCPGDVCEAQITCANLDVLEQDMHVQPHFRLYGQHAEGCEFDRNRSAVRDDLPRSNSRSRTAQGLSHPDVFHLRRPNDHFVRRTRDVLGVGSISRKPRRTSVRSSEADGKERRRDYYSVNNLVSRWLALSKEGRETDCHIRIADTAISYDQLFRKICDQDVQELGDANYVYWGEVRVKRMEHSSGTGYRLSFKQGLRVGSQSVHPTLLIYDDKIERYGLKKLLAGRLQSAVEKPEGACVLFVLGSPIVRPVNDGKGPYVNFNVPNLDMLAVMRDGRYEQLVRGD